MSLRGIYGRPGRVVAGDLRLFTRRALTEFLAASGFRCVTVAGARYHDVPRPLGPLYRPGLLPVALGRVHPAGARAKGMSPPMAQASRTGTGGKHARARHWPARKRAAGRRPGSALEIGGLVAGLAVGLCIALGLFSPASPRHPHGRGAGRTPAAGGAGRACCWTRPRSTRSGRPTRTTPPAPTGPAGTAFSAISLGSGQLAWFFADTYLGPAGPDIGFSDISGFVHNSVVVQTTTGQRAGSSR